MTMLPNVLSCGVGFGSRVVGLSCLAIATAAGAQCPSWAPTFGAVENGVNGPVRAFATFDDDGAGPNAPSLYVGGQFNAVVVPGVVGDPTYGFTEVGTIARWDGTSWSALGGSAAPAQPAGHQWQWSAPGGRLNNSVLALTTFDDGSGTALYAGGLFTAAVNDTGSVALNSIAKWNVATSSWSSLGSGLNGAVYALATFNGKLYAAGTFTTAGGVAAKYIASWNGSTWSKVGSGMDDTVRALTTFDDDGAGPHPLALYAGGYFTKADGKAAKYVASWNGSAWSKLGNGTSDAVFALATFNDGSGTKLYVGGMFASAGGVAGTSRIARWNGSTWSKLAANGMNNTVMSLATYDEDGAGPGGPALYAGGYFTAANGVPNTSYIARWNGAAWSALQDGDSQMLPGTPGTTVVHAVATFDDGGGPALHVGGFFAVSFPNLIPPDADGYLAKWQGCP